MEMLYGKHSGEDMRDIPLEYLQWVADQWEQDDIREAAEEEIQRRWDENPR